MPLDQRTRSNEYAGVIGYPGVMKNQTGSRRYGLDAASAERLLSAADPPEHPRLAELLAAAAAPDSSESVPGAESAIAAYRRDMRSGSESAALTETTGANSAKRAL